MPPSCTRFTVYGAFIRSCPVPYSGTRWRRCFSRARSCSVFAVSVRTNCSTVRFEPITELAEPIISNSESRPNTSMNAAAAWPGDACESGSTIRSQVAQRASRDSSAVPACAALSFSSSRFRIAWVSVSPIWTSTVPSSSVRA